jgi:hypothetical protein
MLHFDNNNTTCIIQNVLTISIFNNCQIQSVLSLSVSRLKLHIFVLLVSILIMASLNTYKVDAKPKKIDPEILDYHLELAEGILETCYARDSDTDSLVPNPTLPILSNLEKVCNKKMKSLDKYLAKFVEDEDGKAYSDQVGNDSEFLLAK